MVTPPSSHQWTALAAMQVRPIIAYRGSVNPKNRDRQVSHPFFTWWWVARGQADIESSGGRWRVEAGHWILLPPEMQRRQRLTDDAMLVSVSFDWSWSTRVPVLSLERPVVCAATAKSKAVGSALRFVRSTEDEQGPGNFWLAGRRLSVAGWLRAEALLRLFLDQLLAEALEHGARLSEPGMSDARLQNVLSDLAHHLRAGPLPYARWQEQVSLSRAQIDRLALAGLGMTMKEWRDRLLADEVRKRLMRSGVSIKETAAELGFVDSAHFNRWVVRCLGQNPTALRGTPA